MVDNTARLCRAPARPRSFGVRLAALAALAAGLCALVLPAAASARRRGCADAHKRITTVHRPALQRAVVCLINQRRRQFGLPGLHADQRLNRSAQGWTNTMVRFRDFSHGSDFAARISAVGFRWSNAGENIATGYRTPTSVVRAWMASTGHCQNILSPVYRQVGTGVSVRGIASAAGTWTQDFGLWMGERDPSGRWAPAERCPYG
jgi:uncharacterized protein YkwD